MPFFLGSLQRWLAAPGSRWLAMVALALAVLCGTTAGVHEDIEDATEQLLVFDELDFEPTVKVKTGQKKAAKASADKRGCGGDKLDLPQGVFARATPFHPALARSEQPHEPLSKRPWPPQPERLLRPPDA
jgi:hypothetical protein